MKNYVKLVIFLIGIGFSFSLLAQEISQKNAIKDVNALKALKEGIERETKVACRSIQVYAEQNAKTSPLAPMKSTADQLKSKQECRYIMPYYRMICEHYLKNQHQLQKFLEVRCDIQGKNRDETCDGFICPEPKTTSKSQ